MPNDPLPSRGNQADNLKTDRWRRSWHAVAILGLLTACSTGSTQPRTPLSLPERFDILYRENGSGSQDILEAPLDSIWKLLPAAYQETGFPAGAATHGNAQIYFTPHLEIAPGKPFYPSERTSTYIDCGSTPTTGPRADSYEVTFVLMTRLTAAEGGHTLVQTLIDGHARPRTSSGHSVPCNGTGRLENQIVDSLRRLAKLPRRSASSTIAGGPRAR